MPLRMPWARVCVCVCVCVSVCVYLCEIVEILWCPRVIWYKLSGALFPFWPHVKNFDENPEEETLIACTYCDNTGIVLKSSPPSHLLLFHPHMQAVFHLSFLSSSVACNCWARQPMPPPLGGSRAISTSRLDDAHSHWHDTRNGGWWMFTQHSHNTKNTRASSSLTSEQEALTIHLDDIKQHGKL